MFNLETTAIISKLANEFGLETAALLAVVETESAGVAFWKVGNFNKPAIRFEGHYFYARLSGAKRDEAVRLGLAAEKAGVVKNPSSYSARYALLERARAFDENAALESTSWGLGQVMGAHWASLGYKSVKDFVAAQNTIEGQVEAMLRFIKVNNLIRHIKSKNWSAFAKAYNGPGYRKNNYHTKMADAYIRYSTGTVAQSDISLIRLMQTMLNTVGNYELTVTGIHDDVTRTALMDYQLKNGLVADGVYGPLSRAELEKDYKAVGNQRVDFIGKVGAGSGTIGATVTEAANNIQPLAEVSHIMQYLFFALILVGVSLTVWATIKGNNNGN